MSAQRAGFNQYASTIQILDDSDNRDAASVGVALEGLTDRTAFLRGLADSQVAQNWHRFTYTYADATSLINYTDGIAMEGFLVFAGGEPTSKVVTPDGRVYDLTANTIDVSVRAQHPTQPYMLAVEQVTDPHTTAGLKTEISGDAGANWSAGDDVTVNLKVYHAEWANVSTSIYGGAWVLAASDKTNDHPYVCLFDAGGTLLSSTNLEAASMADQNFSCIAVGGADGSHVILAEDGFYWLTAEGAGNAVSWTKHSGPWTTGVKIDWSAESGWVAVWQESTLGEFKWSTSADGITWGTPATESFAYTGTHGDSITGSSASGGNGSGQGGKHTFKVLRGLWIISTCDSESPRIGARLTYSTDQGATWWHHGLNPGATISPPELAKTSSGLAFCIEGSTWVSLRAGNPGFGG